MSLAALALSRSGSHIAQMGVPEVKDSSNGGLRRVNYTWHNSRKPMDFSGVSLSTARLSKPTPYRMPTERSMEWRFDTAAMQPSSDIVPVKFKNQNSAQIRD